MVRNEKIIINLFIAKLVQFMYAIIDSYFLYLSNHSVSKPLKIQIFSIFFPLGQKKSFQFMSKSIQVCLLFTAGQKYARPLIYCGSGPISIFYPLFIYLFI